MAISGIGGIYGARGYYNYSALANRRIQNRGYSGIPRNYGYGSNYQSTSKFARKYSNIMSDLLKSANALAEAGRSGVMNRYAVSSSNTNVATVTMEWPMYAPKDIELDVEQIARAQRNVSDDVAGDGNATSNMNFQVAGTGNVSVSVNALNDDGTAKTNRQMLEEAAGQINAGGAGVKARVVERDGMVSLEVESENTGTSSQFSITGDLGAASGLDNVADTAENARYKVTSDGQTRSYTSESNDIQLETGKIGVTLKGTGRTDISVHSDMDGIASAVEDLIKKYNKAIDFLGDNSDRGTGVERQLDNLARAPLSDKSLKVLGIERNSDGTMEFDKETFLNNMKKDPDFTRELLSGQFGLAQRASAKAQSGLAEKSESLFNREMEGGIFSVSYPNGTRVVMSGFGGYGGRNSRNNDMLGRMLDLMV